MQTFDFDNLTGRDKIYLIYTAYYGRLPDPEGFHFWNEFFGIETSTGNSSEGAALLITDFFLDQEETRSNYQFFENPSNAGVDDVGLFLDEVYQNLFNRAPDEDGKAFWSQQIADRLEAGIGFSDILTQIIEGAQPDDIPAIDNKLVVANYYVQNIGESFDLAQATSLAASITGADNTVQQAILEIDAQILLDAPTNEATNPRATISAAELLDTHAIDAAFVPVVEDVTVVGTQLPGDTSGDAIM